MRNVPTSRTFELTQSRQLHRRHWRASLSAKTATMKTNLSDTLSGFRSPRIADAALSAVKRMPALFNDAGTTLHKRHLPRIIGITEQRLRARNQGFWTMGAKAWKKLTALYRD